MDWRDLKYHLFNALTSLSVNDIYCLQQENNVVDLIVVLDDDAQAQKLRELTKMRVIDELIAKHSPAIYKEYLFTYEVWGKRAWDLLPVSRFSWRRRRKQPEPPPELK